VQERLPVRPYNVLIISDGFSEGIHPMFFEVFPHLPRRRIRVAVGAKMRARAVLADALAGNASAQLRKKQNNNVLKICVRIRKHQKQAIFIFSRNERQRERYEIPSKKNKSSTARRLAHKADAPERPSLYSFSRSGSLSLYVAAAEGICSVRRLRSITKACS